jgi:hypothetical protein
MPGGRMPPALFHFSYFQRTQLKTLEIEMKKLASVCLALLLIAASTLVGTVSVPAPVGAATAFSTWDCQLNEESCVEQILGVTQPDVFTINALLVSNFDTPFQLAWSTVGRCTVDIEVSLSYEDNGFYGNPPSKVIVQGWRAQFPEYTTFSDTLNFGEGLVWHDPPMWVDESVCELNNP